MKPYLAMIIWEDNYGRHTSPVVVYATSLEAAQAQAHDVANMLPFGNVGPVEEV